MNLCDGIVRGRWRRAQATDATDADRRTPVPLEPGAAERYEIDLMVTGNTFLGRPSDPRRDLVEQLPALRPEPEHRAPARRRTPCSGVARQTVLHDAAHPSHIVLPVVPG